MSDLRAARKTLETYIIRCGDADSRLGPTWQEAMNALDVLIPEGAVLVTEETLAAAITATHWYDASSKDALHEAAAILRHLREGT